MLQSKYRLRKNIEFDKVYKNQQKFRGDVFQIYTLKNSLENPRFGIVVSKKIGKACVRNLTKRRISEIIRTNIKSIQTNTDFVIVTYPQIVSRTFVELKESILRVLLFADSKNISK